MGKIDDAFFELSKAIYDETSYEKAADTVGLIADALKEEGLIIDPKIKEGDVYLLNGGASVILRVYQSHREVIAFSVYYRVVALLSFEQIEKDGKYITSIDPKSIFKEDIKYGV